MQLHGWLPSMYTHHIWVLLEKILSSDFLLLKNLGCYKQELDQTQAQVPDRTRLYTVASRALRLRSAWTRRGQGSDRTLTRLSSVGNREVLESKNVERTCPMGGDWTQSDHSSRYLLVLASQ